MSKRTVLLEEIGRLQKLVKAKKPVSKWAKERIMELKRILAKQPVIFVIVV